MFTSPRIPCDHRQHPMTIWILVTILIGLLVLCQVRETVAVFCHECYPRATQINDLCFHDDLAGGVNRNTEGCFVYQISYVGSTIFHSGGRDCLEQKHLDCIRKHTGLDMKDGRCLRTTVKEETADKLSGVGCMNYLGKSPSKPTDYKGMDVRICTCKGENCNKAEIWKPDEFKEEKANEGGGGGTGGAGGSGGGPVVGNGSAKQVKTAAWSLIITIGIVFFNVCPFQ